MRTLNNPQAQLSLIREFSRFNLSLLLLSEVRWTDSGEAIVSDGDALSYKMLYSGGDSHAAGVGILLNKAMSEALVAFHPVNNRIAFAHFKNDPLPLCGCGLRPC